MQLDMQGAFWELFFNNPTVYRNKYWPGHLSDSFGHFNVSLPFGY